MMRRAVIIAAILVAAGVVGYWFLQQGAVQTGATAQDLETVTVERGNIEATVDATGSVEPAAQVTLSFRTGGILSSLPVSEGDEVREGEILAEVNASELRLGVTQAQLALTSAEASQAKLAGGADVDDIQAARANLASAEAALARMREGPSADEITVAMADLRRAEIALQEAQELYDQYSWVSGIGALPQSVALQQTTINYEQAQAAYNITMQGPTESELRAAEAAVAQARGQLSALLEGASQEDLTMAQVAVDQARASLELAQLQLEGATITAPFDGVVAFVGAEVNEQAAPGSPMIVLIDPSGFHVEVSVDEIDVGQVELEQEARITLDAYPDEELQGRVEYISPVATEDLGTVSYLVRVGFDPSPVPLRSGMTANITIVTERRENVLLMPSRAISTDRDTGLFYVERLKADGEIERVEVEIGIQDATYTEVLRGLQEGDQLVIGGVSIRERLRMGM
ncbi:MAG: efflux RND transporter periplasmic adaptor subunit [Anaerolineae bacterium]|nr:efflux RND transporter periplasmic adaptor subunit [Anaerolineae bacterium]